LLAQSCAKVSDVCCKNLKNQSYDLEHFETAMIWSHSSDTSGPSPRDGRQRSPSRRRQGNRLDRSKRWNRAN
jgi:hypothetical protein